MKTTTTTMALAIAAVLLAGSASRADTNCAAAGFAAATCNDNSTTNQGGQGGDAFQAQGQIQGQIAAGGDARAYGGDASARSYSDSSAYSGGNNLGAVQGVYVGGDVHKAAEIPVSSAVAPALAAGASSCAGSISGGLALMDVGVALGGTTPDDECERRAWAATLIGAGETAAATALLCADGGMAGDAMRAAGRCGTDPTAQQHGDGAPIAFAEIETGANNRANPARTNFKQ